MRRQLSSFTELLETSVSPSPQPPPARGGGNHTGHPALKRSVPSPLAGEGQGEGCQAFTQFSIMNAFLFILVSSLLGGCVGARTFHEVARAGDTVTVAAGWKHYFTRENITVTITPSSGSSIVLPPNDPAIRAVVNLYPDPVSSVLVSQETDQDLTPYARTYADLVSSIFTAGDKDWWQTSVFVDLPSSLPVGDATIAITTPQGESTTSVVEIVSGAGRPNTFQTTLGPISATQLLTMQRVQHFTVNFSGSVVPYAAQLDFTHNPDRDHGGTGRAHVINPRGDIKNVSWRDDGASLRVIITPAKNAAPTNIKDFKFYVAGGITGLQVVNVKSFDINGNVMSGVTAAIGSD